MFVVSGDRGRGKTTELIIDSCKFNIPIVTINPASVKQKAEELKLKIPEPISGRTFFSDEMRGKKIDKVLIDEVGLIIQQLTQAKVVGIAENIQHIKSL